MTKGKTAQGWLGYKLLTQGAFWLNAIALDNYHSYCDKLSSLKLHQRSTNR
jgi:hypothetical protein